MQTNDDEAQDPETAAIILKVKRKKLGADDAGGSYSDDSGGDPSEAALRSAGDDLFQAIRGRTPNEQESDAVFAAVKSIKNC